MTTKVLATFVFFIFIIEKNNEIENISSLNITITFRDKFYFLTMTRKHLLRLIISVMLKQLAQKIGTGFGFGFEVVFLESGNDFFFEKSASLLFGSVLITVVPPPLSEAFKTIS